jgi:hypothetical protein
MVDKIKRNAGFIWVVALVIMFACIMFAYAALPVSKNYYTNIGSYTANNDATGDWDSTGALIYVASDSAATLFEVTGTAVLYPGQKAYFGLTSDSNDVTRNHGLFTDTIVYPKKMRGGAFHMPFYFSYARTNLAGVTDTVYLNVACGGSTPMDYVALRNIIMTASIKDYQVQSTNK